jgi:hypothetical protein
LLLKTYFSRNKFTSTVKEIRKNFFAKQNINTLFTKPIKQRLRYSFFQQWKTVSGGWANGVTIKNKQPTAE